MDREQAKAFLGVGWKFPVCVDEATGRIKTCSYEEDIKEAIRIIIMTNPGERMMRPDFGCGMQEQVFSGMDYSARSQIEHDVMEALTEWEPRITEVEVEVDTDDMGGNLTLNIGYTVRATNNMFNVVYPYFMNEGE